ncbi:unnamed protein product, partial [Rotaria sp. Silwood1]
MNWASSNTNDQSAGLQSQQNI